MARVRNVCWTIHVKPEENVNFVIQRTRDSLEAGRAAGKVSYYVFQPECCPETKRNHLQGYVELTNPTGYGTIKATILNADHAHLEKRQGTSKQAADYCKKPESRIGHDFYEGGEISAPGKRNDLLEIATAIQEGKSLRSIAEAQPVAFIRNCRGIERLCQFYDRPVRRSEPRVLFLYGPTGVGKTRAITEAVSRIRSVYWARENEKRLWFDGYIDETLVVFDEFIGQAPVQDMLCLLDRRPLRLEIKGSTVRILANWFILSSNIHPSGLYAGPNHDAWIRRTIGEATFIDCTHKNYPSILQDVKLFLSAFDFIVID